MLPSAVEGEARAFPEEFQRVFGRRCHGDTSSPRPLNPRILILSGRGWEVNTNDVNGLEKEHRERSEETQVDGSVVLYVTERMRLSVISTVRFARASRYFRQWCRSDLCQRSYIGMQYRKRECV
jgi:hypothetical protein